MMSTNAWWGNARTPFLDHQLYHTCIKWPLRRGATLFKQNHHFFVDFSSRLTKTEVILFAFFGFLLVSGGWENPRDLHWQWLKTPMLFRDKEVEMEDGPFGNGERNCLLGSQEAAV